MALAHKNMTKQHLILPHTHTHTRTDRCDTHSLCRLLLWLFYCYVQCDNGIGWGDDDETRHTNTRTLMAAVQTKILVVIETTRTPCCCCCCRPICLLSAADDDRGIDWVDRERIKYNTTTKCDRRRRSRTRSWPHCNWHTTAAAGRVVLFFSLYSSSSPLLWVTCVPACVRAGECKM